MSYDCSRQRSLPTFLTMIVQTNIPSKNWGLLLSRTTLTPKPCGLLSMETIRDSSARYFPLSQTIGNEYVSLFTTSQTIADSSGRYYLLSRTMSDEYVFHSIMSNRLSDRYPCRGVLNTPLARLSSTISPFAGRLVGRMQYAPTLPAEKSDLKGWRGIMFGAKGEESVFLFSMSRTIADSLGRYYLLYRTVRDKYVFHFFMSNRLSDRYLGRAQKHMPLARLSSTISPFAGRLVGRMQYAPTLSEKERFPRVGITYCLGQRWINTYFISSCLIGCQIGTHVGRIEYAPYRFNVYPFAPCGAFGRAYAIRPYISGKRQGFLGYVFSIVSDNGG